MTETKFRTFSLSLSSLSLSSDDIFLPLLGRFVLHLCAVKLLNGHAADFQCEGEKSIPLAHCYSDYYH